MTRTFDSHVKAGQIRCGKLMMSCRQRVLSLSILTSLNCQSQKPMVTHSLGTARGLKILVSGSLIPYLATFALFERQTRDRRVQCRYWYLFKRLTVVSGGPFYRFEHIVTYSSGKVVAK